MLRMLFPGATVRDVFKRSSSALMVAAMVLSAAAPLLLSGNANALQLTERKITLGSSKRGQTDVTYTVSFKPGSTASIQGVVIEFCANSPLVGSACTAPTVGNTLEAFDVNEAGLAVTAGYTVDAATTANRIILTHAGAAYTAGTTETITLGGAGASDGITNPNPTTPSPATFYARIVTYTSSANAQAYTDTAPGTHTDEGGIALSTANQLTVNARVQEELEFCVGAVASTVISDATAPANCADAAFSGTTPTVDIGVVSSSGPTVSPVVAAAGGNDTNGAVLIRTNGVNGASVTYFAEQNNSSGRLKVAGSTCSGTTAFDATSGVTDQCFNSNSSEADAGNNFRTSVAGEKFGMTAGKVLRPTGSTTTNLTRDTNYDGSGTVDNVADCVPATADSANCFAWQSAGTTTALATSSTVLDYEMLLLNFAARAAATTPTGFYAVTSTYVATPTF